MELLYFDTKMFARTLQKFKLKSTLNSMEHKRAKGRSTKQKVESEGRGRIDLNDTMPRGRTN
jgi:hypothetical protein